MTVDLPKFFATAMQLYELWPSLFNWTAGGIALVLVLFVTATWWMRGYKADARQAALEGEKIALNGQLDGLLQRLTLATEQQKMATEHAKSFEAHITTLREKIAKDILVDRDLQMLIAKLDISLGRLMATINSVSGTLTPPSGMAYASASRVGGNDKKIEPAIRNRN